MKFNFFLKTVIVGIVILLFASCDRDFNEIGSGIVGDEHYGMNKYISNVVAYNQALGPVQSNNLPINQFGYYNNPVFGKTTASYVTQLELAVPNPTFYDQANVVVDSVYLYVPYYSTFLSTDTDSGDSTYELDSIQGNSNIKLSIYESNKFLETYDYTNGPQQLQKYYSNQQTQFESEGMIAGNRLNNDNGSIYDAAATNDHSQNDEFSFNSKQIKLYKEAAHTNVAERKAPGMFINLDKNFFRNKIVNAPSGKLYNNNVFKNYFRGLYFKVEAAASSPNQGTLAMMNFARGTITMIYHDKTSDTDATVIRKTLTLNFAGNTVNFLENDNNLPGYVTPNPIIGDDNLYLKGGNGSMAIIDLFGGKKNDDLNPELKDMRDHNWLINEASLTFYIDKTKLGTSAPEPNRIYLYDLTHNRPLADFFVDATTSSSTKFNKYIHGGILLDDNSQVVKVADGTRGTKYKIRITNHIRNLVKFGGSAATADSTNVRLGLVVTESISTVNRANLQSTFTTTNSANPDGTLISKYVPVMSVVNPLGTVLYGSTPNVPSDKRLQLEIYYTKPD